MKKQLNYRILEEERFELCDENDTMVAVFATRRIAEQALFRRADEALIATVASELAVNIIRYAGKGELTIQLVEDTFTNLLGILLFAHDEGPGIDDVDGALSENYSTSVSSLGLGLPSVVRIMDHFNIESKRGKGTDIKTIKWRHYDRGGLHCYDPSVFR